MTALSRFQVGWGTTLAIKTLVVLGLVPLATLILGYVFLLKMMSHMQSRLGPMDPGGFHGWFQLIGDGIKFMQKEDLFPAKSDRRVFALAPVVVVMSTFLIFVVIPAGSERQGRRSERRCVLRARGVEPLGDRRAHGRLGERQQVRAASARSARPRSSSPTSCRSCLRSSAS